jgi:hypothetical protein
MCIASKVEAAVAIAKEATSNQKVRGKLSGSGGRGSVLGEQGGGPIP